MDKARESYDLRPSKTNQYQTEQYPHQQTPVKSVADEAGLGHPLPQRKDDATILP